MSADDIRDLIKLAGSAYNRPPIEIPREAMWARIRLARDYNQMKRAVPRERMWKHLVLWRAAQRAEVQQTRHLGVGRRFSVRDVAASTRRARGGWMIVPAAAAAACALFVAVQMQPQRPGANPGFRRSIPVIAEGESRNSQQDVSAGAMFAANFSPRWLAVSSVEDPASDAFRRAAVTHLKKSEALVSAFPQFGGDQATSRQTRTSIRDLLSATRLLIDAPLSAKLFYRPLLQDLELVLLRMSIVSRDTFEQDRDAITVLVDRKKLLPRIREQIPQSSTSHAN